MITGLLHCDSPWQQPRPCGLVASGSFVGRVNEFVWGGEGAAVALCQPPPAAVEVAGDSRVLSECW